METILVIIRVAVLLLAAFNMIWTAKTVFKPQTQLATFGAGIFWLGAGTISFQIFALTGTANIYTRVCSTIILTIGFLTVASLRKQTPLLRKFAKLLRHVEVASAIADLAEIDKDGADRMASMCRRKTAEASFRG